MEDKSIIELAKAENNTKKEIEWAQAEFEKGVTEDNAPKVFEALIPLFKKKGSEKEKTDFQKKMKSCPHLSASKIDALLLKWDDYKQPKRPKLLKEPQNSGGLKAWFLNAKCFKDVEDVTKYVWLHNTTFEECFYELRSISNEMSAEDYEELSNSYTCAEFRYTPFEKRKYYQKDNGIYVFNTYCPPDWQRAFFYKKAEIPNPAELECPEIIKDHLIHLTGGEAGDVDRILDWCANSLYTQNKIAITMLSECQGNGKSMFAKVVAAVHGKKNSARIKSDFFKKEFNIALKDKTFAYFDEANVTGEVEQGRMRELFEDEIEIEGKGDNSFSAANFCNYIFISNNLKAVEVGENHRRHECINMTNDKLIKAAHLSKYGADMGEYADKLFSPETISSFANYLYFRRYFEIKKGSLDCKRDTAKEARVQYEQLTELERNIVVYFLSPNVKIGDSLDYNDMKLWNEQFPGINNMKGDDFGRRRMEKLKDKYPTLIKLVTGGKDKKMAKCGDGKFLRKALELNTEAAPDQEPKKEAPVGSDCAKCGKWIANGEDHSCKMDQCNKCFEFIGGDHVCKK